MQMARHASHGVHEREDDGGTTGTSQRVWTGGRSWVGQAKEGFNMTLADERIVGISKGDIISA